MKNTIVAIVTVLVVGTATANDTHLFILSGQSNMARMKPERDFLPEVQRLLPDAEILHVKAAFSGKPIRNWLEEWDELARGKGLDPTAVRETDKVDGSPFYGRIMDAVKPHLAEPPASISFIWMQGESDAKNGAEVVYEESLRALVAKLRKDLAAPEMNVVVARISDFGEKNAKGKVFPGWAVIRKAQEKVVANDPRGALVNVDDCNGPRDGLHYPPEGYTLMGHRMAQQAVALIKGKTPAADKMPQDRPNILWITAEDMSANLGCYGDPDAITPALDRLAKRGVRYTNAFAGAPVCTPARNGLITGMHASSLGAQHLRDWVVLPDHIKCFSEFLRNAGYYCSNNFKEDYNFRTPESAWDDSSKTAHWRNRPEGKPFFSVFNIQGLEFSTHQSRTRYDSETLKKVNESLPPNKRHTPEGVTVWPFYPDTSAVRVNLAAYHTQITKLDTKVNDILRELIEDSLVEETIVFFFADHGMGLPRGKRWLHDGGLRVPLLLRFPAKYQHVAPGKPGSVEDRLVSFIDFGPTVLSLAGVDIPKHMQGKAFLGEGESPRRDWIHGVRGRVDEVTYCSRTLHDGRYQYIRNFYPHRPRMSYCAYSEKTPIRQELRRLDKEGALSGHTDWLMQRRTPVEELYDGESDPWQLNNLADDPKYADMLAGKRELLRETMMTFGDTGMHTEMQIHRRSRFHEISPFEMMAEMPDAEKNRILDLMFMGGAGQVGPARGALADPSASVRYWAAVNLAISGERAAPAEAELLTALDDEDGSVRVPAAESLCNIGLAERGMPALLAIVGEGGRNYDGSLACKALSARGMEKLRPWLPQIKERFETCQGMGSKTLGYLVSELESAESAHE